MPETLVAYIDGASRGNPGPGAYAVVVRDERGAQVDSISKTLGKTTNNFAEYQALLAALEYAREHKRRKVKIFSDSELLVRQIEGLYRVRSEALKPLHERAIALIRELESFSISHVAREQNREADALANQALNGARRAAGLAPSLAPNAEKASKTQNQASQATSEARDNAQIPVTTITSQPAPLTVLTEEESMFQAAAYEFALKEITPHVQEMDRGGFFKKELLDQFFTQGFMAVSTPQKYGGSGGSGGSLFMSILAVEAFARVDASASVIIDVQNTLVSNAILRWGSEEQRSRYLARLAKDTVGAYALSEPASGSDAFGLETQACKNGEHYLLNGRKLWITNASEAGLFIIFATLDRELGHRGITAFLVERGAAGFSVGKKEDKLGIRASSTCELILDDCQVHEDSILGSAGDGYKVAIETLNEGRIGIAAQMAGVARGALDHAVAYAKERRQFGRAIADFQAIQFQIARLATEIEAARLMTYNAARLKDAGQPFTREAAMAKYFSSQVAERVASECVEIFGGYGYTKDYPAEKYLRDAKIGKIYEGTSFIQLQTIAKSILGRP